MASIKTSIELYDNFSDPMMGIIDAANAGTAAIESVQAAMDAGIDMSGINRANAAMQSFENTVQAFNAPSFSFGNVDATLPDFNIGSTIPSVTVPVTPIVTEQPRIDVPTGIEIPVSAEVTEQPQIDVPDGITVPMGFPAYLKRNRESPIFQTG